ncbi:uncharacterized protein LOC125606624 [Brassica napus]|uniref:uncharacterized protein LOC125606624 n=1 Tax=Brassica napus TaxID=3708 RepID=UPI0020785036|nr:uncharacterized protein LOC125606624 [Brassica napus]
MLHQIFCVLKRVWQLVKLDNCLEALDNPWNLYGNHSSHYRTCKTGTWQATSNRGCDARSSSVIGSGRKQTTDVARVILQTRGQGQKFLHLSPLVLFARERMSLKRFVRPILPKAKGKEGLSQMLHQIFWVLKRVWQLVKLDNLPGSTRQSQQPLQNL